MTDFETTGSQIFTNIQANGKHKSRSKGQLSDANAYPPDIAVSTLINYCPTYVLVLIYVLLLQLRDVVRLSLDNIDVQHERSCRVTCCGCQSFVLFI